MDIIFAVVGFILDLIHLGLLVTGLMTWMYTFHIYRNRHSPMTRFFIDNSKAVRDGK